MSRQGVQDVHKTQAATCGFRKGSELYPARTQAVKTWHIGHVVGVRIYRNDVVVVRSGAPPPPSQPERGEVMEFSTASRKRLAFVCSNTAVEFRTMITLTYPREYPSDGRVVKKHLNHFLITYRREYGPCSYLWFLEFQARGAPHIHLLTDVPLPRRDKDALGLVRLRISTIWYNIVGSRDSRHLAAGTRTETIRKKDGARHYGVKYAQKMRQKIVPEDYRNVGRFWGCSRDVVPEEPPLISCTEDDIRGELEGWKYAPSDDRPVYRVCYNTASRFSAHG